MRRPLFHKRFRLLATMRDPLSSGSGIVLTGQLAHSHTHRPAQTSVHACGTCWFALKDVTVGEVVEGRASWSVAGVWLRWKEAQVCDRVPVQLREATRQSLRPT